MMLGNVNPGPDDRQQPDPGRPAPLLAVLFYILCVLSVIGTAIAFGMADGPLAFGGIIGAVLWFAIGRYLHQQADRQAEMVELMRERNERR